MEVKFAFKSSLKGQNNEGTWNRICGGDRVRERKTEKMNVLVGKEINALFLSCIFIFYCLPKGNHYTYV